MFISPVFQSVYSNTNVVWVVFGIIHLGRMQSFPKN